MPELPEVETICRGLAGYLSGQRLERVLVRRRDLRLPVPHDFESRLTGRTVQTVGRRAKYLLIFLDDDTVVIGHLGMSGRLYVKASTPSLGAHDHVIFETASGPNQRTVIFHDPRRFGLLVLGSASTLEKHDLLRDLGPEPLGPELSAARLRSSLMLRSRTPLKAALLDQTVVAGLGNIYVCEALHRAGFSPDRLAGTLTQAESGELLRAIRSVLKDALAAGGSTLRDYVQADGEVGSFQNLFRVYNCEGQPCSRKGCRGNIKRVMMAGRSTYFCSCCQK